MKDKLPPIHRTIKGQQYVRLPNPGSGITIDPDIHCGEPCLRGTRIPCTSLYGEAGGGLKRAWVSDARGLTEAQVQAAIDYVEGV